VIHENHLHWGESCIQECLTRQATWHEIVEELQRGGFSETEVTTLLRPQHAWVAEAREMKAEGYPYEDILYELNVVLKATWADVARALVEVGVPSADVLRLVLPSMDGDDYWPVIQSVLMEEANGEDDSEACSVVNVFISEEAAFGKLELSSVANQKALLREKLARHSR
jgi:hypothetical protein